jgi:short-subunit dehydrogenase
MTAETPVALITGASSGIGLAYADRLARRGHDLVLVARRAERLRALADRLAATYSIDVRTVAADLTQLEDIASLETLIRSEPRLHTLVNNAGIGRLSPSMETSDADAAFTLDLNVVAPTRLSRAALPGLLARNAGAIINIASVMAVEVLPVTTLYSATKSYLLVFSRGLQLETAGTGVRIQAVLPASTATEFWDSAGVPLSALDPASIMTPDQVVDAALAGFDQGETVTFPTVEDDLLWSRYEAARQALFAATQTGRPARRYGLPGTDAP